MTQTNTSFPDDDNNENTNFFESQYAGEIQEAEPQTQNRGWGRQPAQIMAPSEVSRGYVTAAPRSSWGMRKFERETAMEHARDNRSARLAAQAKNNVAKLTLMEDGLMEIAPGGAKGYKAIKTAYIIKAIDRITSV